MLLPCGAQPFDGTWWNAKSLERRQGFLNGEADCYHWVLRAPARPFRTFQYQVEQLDRFYATPANLKIPIETAQKKLPPDPDLNLKVEGGHAHPGKHGYWDGAYWREAGPDGDLGFVEGYIACLPNGRALFPLPYSRYVGWVDEWYSKKDPSERSKIADVLDRFRAKRGGGDSNALPRRLNPRRRADRLPAAP